MPDASSERYVLLNRLADEFAARYRRGERPQLQEYCDRHPELADDIRDLFPALVEVEQAKGEVGGMAGRARHMMSIAEASLADVVLPPKEGFERRIAREPLGVVFDLPAWNYPLLTAVNAVIPAVLAGNVVVLKHSPRSPLCGEHFARAFEDSGAPKATVQALHCDHPTSERIAGEGVTAVERQIQAAASAITARIAIDPMATGARDRRTAGGVRPPGRC